MIESVSSIPLNNILMQTTIASDYSSDYTSCDRHRHYQEVICYSIEFAVSSDLKDNVEGVN